MESVILNRLLFYPMAALRSHRPIEFWRWLIRRYRRYQIANHSMEPTISAGVEILYDPRAYLDESPQTDDIVIARHPVEGFLIVKRVTERLPDGHYLLMGDNRPISQDSRTFGPVAPELIVGKVLCVFA